MTAGIVLAGAAGVAVLRMHDRAITAAVEPPALAPAALFQLADAGAATIPANWNFQFPADHAAHPRQRTEAWSLSGVLRDARERQFGMQFTILRVALRQEPSTRESRWAASEAYAALLAVTDPDSGRMRVEQRASRAVLGLAGAQADPVRVWTGDWRLEEEGAAAGAIDLRLDVTAGEIAWSLRLMHRKPLLDSNAMREAGATEATPFVGYTQPLMAATGTMRAGDDETTLSGKFVLEHAWGELPLPGSPVARDRFTLFLDDEREILLLRTHRTGGFGAPRTSGVYVGAGGRPAVLPARAVDLEPVGFWTSERTGVRYPTRWTLEIPEADIELELVPQRVDQENVTWSPLWTGLVRIGGPSSVGGTGMMQLNGYRAE